MYYCYTISADNAIITKFERVRKDSGSNNYFCMSSFESKDDCIDFAKKIELMKFEICERDFIIKLTTSKTFLPFLEFLR